MVVMTASSIGKSYGIDVILENITFSIEKGDRIGIVGINGAGKTTLLNVLTGEASKTSGSLYIAKGQKIGYLKQIDDFEQDETIIEVAEKVYRPIKELEIEIVELNEKISGIANKKLESDKQDDIDKELKNLYDKISFLQDKFERVGGFSYKSEKKGILSAMNFPENTYDKKIKTLSGGERTRLALAILLMEKPDILILDEPTNHLDMGTLNWLEQYISNYNGTVIETSHDRYFLDETVTKIFDIENHKLKVYKGNYTQYVEKKKADLEARLKAFKKEEEEIKRQEILIRKYKERGTEKLAKRAASREKKLEKIDRLEKPEILKDSFSLSFKENFPSGKDVFFGEGIVKYLGEGDSRRKILNNLNFDIKRGEKICIIGANGTGKTTFLKILVEKLFPNEGYFKIGHNVDIGYYDQNQDSLNQENTLKEELHNEFRNYTDGEIRGFLGRFLFSNEQVTLKVKELSGGEKGRLTLIKLMLGGHNVLILDEPTNHIDIKSKEIIEEALTNFEGTVITVSHDRYFLNRIPGRILELTRDGFKEYLGNYKYYLEKTELEKENKRAEITSSFHIEKALQLEESKENEDESFSSDLDKNKNLTSREFRLLKKEEDKKKKKLLREKEEIEEKMLNKEDEIRAKQDEIIANSIDLSHVEMAKLGKEQENLTLELSDLEERWLELEEKLLEIL